MDDEGTFSNFKELNKTLTKLVSEVGEKDLETTGEGSVVYLCKKNKNNQ